MRSAASDMSATSAPVACVEASRVGETVFGVGAGTGLGSWHLRLLGAVVLCDAHGHVTRWPSRAVALLLARLALAPQRQHPREELVELIWPGVQAEVGRNRLRQALSVLRSLVEPAEHAGHAVVLVDRRNLWLAPDALQCDVADFRQALARRDAAQARACYGGELMPGYFEDWVVQERGVLQALADALPAESSWLAALERAGVPSPARSSPTTELAAAGRPLWAAAPAQGHVLVPVAVPVPMPEHEENAGHAIGWVAPTAHLAPPQAEVRLPRYLTRLLGFEAEGATLRAALAEHRLVVVRGPGGAGKTRLAVEVARELGLREGWVPAEHEAEPSFSLVLFVPLAACSSRAQLLDALLLALRQEGPASTADPAERVEQALSGRRVLLVLDNFEQLVECGRDDLARWLERLPQLVLLVTSRCVLGLDGEVEHSLAPLTLPNLRTDRNADVGTAINGASSGASSGGISAGVITGVQSAPPEAAHSALSEHAMNPAVALFVDRARAVRADFHLTARNHHVVAQIVTALHGLPLAIELAAARVRSLGLAEMQALLTQGAADGHALELLARAGPRAGHDPRHASMLGVLAWSWERLAAAERSLLERLSVCAGGASLELLSRLCGWSPADVALRLEGLVASSVVYQLQSASEPLWGQLAQHAAELPLPPSRYYAYEPMREYVALQLGVQGMARLRSVHARAMASWANALGPAPALAAARADWANLQLALATAADPAADPGSAQCGIDTLLAARAVLHDLALHPGALDNLRAAAVHAPGYRRALLQAVLAAQSYEAGQHEQAGAHAQAALAALAPSPGQVPRPAAPKRAPGAPQDVPLKILQNALTKTREKAGESPAALADEEFAEVLCEASRVLMRLGAAPGPLRIHLNQALALAQARNHGDLQARALRCQAVLVYRVDGDKAQAAQLHAQALALWQAHGPHSRTTGGLINYAVALGFLRQLPQQLLVLAQARQQAAALGQPRALASACSVTGYALADLARYAEAAAMFRTCLQLAWSQADWRAWCYALYNLPRTLAHQRSPQAAAHLLGFAQAFFTQRFGPFGAEDLPEARRTQRLVAAQVGREAALRWIQEGARLTQSAAMQLALEQTTPGLG